MGQTQTKRLEFHQLLVSAMGEGYKVYFQPPETVKMQYPCVVYHRRYLDSNNADNIKYLTTRQYQVILISRDPDDDGVDKLFNLPYSHYLSHSVVDNLYHDAFEIYY